MTTLIIDDLPVPNISLCFYGDIVLVRLRMIMWVVVVEVG